MRRKNGFLFALAVILLIIVSLITAGCKTTPTPKSEPIVFEYLTDPGFPTVFIGTWVREGSTDLKSTRTFTTNTYRISTQYDYWVLEKVSGDTYTLSPSGYRSQKATETIKYENGKLIISPCGGDGENDCGGVWVKQ